MKNSDLCDNCEKRHFCYGDVCTKVQIKIDAEYAELQSEEFRNKDYQQPEDYSWLEANRKLRKY